MKQIFQLLLVINLGIFIWSYPREQAAVRLKPAVRPDIGSLLLLSERRMLFPDEPEPEPEAVPLPAPEPLSEPVGGPEEEATQPAALQQLAREAFLAEASPPSEGPGPPPADETEKKAAREPEPVPMTEPMPETARVAEAGEPAAEKTCYRLGPVETRLSAEKLVDRLASWGLAAGIQEEEVKTQAGYWVLFPPLESTEAARKKLQDLKAAGITDVWRFTSGRLRNAISLGLFSRLKNAERVREQAGERGFLPELRPHFTRRTEYWLHFESAREPVIPEEARQRLREEYAGLEPAPHACLDSRSF